ncbi:hypothetical protein vBDshSR4C_008 [Dinoroseobacter phage vB_DshS-R4C]|nr:hypothetical protein vBDshSR4C_008 [Dinoroseobacter phage vB_DshS-R4C]
MKKAKLAAPTRVAGSVIPAGQDVTAAAVGQTRLDRLVKKGRATIDADRAEAAGRPSAALPPPADD